MRAFFSLEYNARHQASPSVSTRSFCESILFVRLEALRGSERRVVSIVGMVGLKLDETPNSFLISCFSNIYRYTLFPRFTAESWLCDMLRSVLFLRKIVNDFLRLNLDFCESARMRFHCPSGQVVLRSCATEREHCSPLLLR